MGLILDDSGWLVAGSGLVLREGESPGKARFCWGVMAAGIMVGLDS